MISKVRESLEKINLQAKILYDELLSSHCTFKVGGPADILIQPYDVESLQRALVHLKALDVPRLLIGGGANIVPSDKGFRGAVIDTSLLKKVEIKGHTVKAEAGIAISELSALVADAGLAGLDFIYAMPGSLGGAVYMNARCYDSEMSEVLQTVSYLDSAYELKTLQSNPSLYQYKLSPFTNKPYIIVEAVLHLKTGNKPKLWARMKELEADRSKKGHFMAPCAGSVFKNNHDFGAPSGKIIDELELRGHRIGGAQISPLHANIIINTGTASAKDIYDLTMFVQKKVFEKKGFLLEPEVLFVGDWT